MPISRIAKQDWYSRRCQPEHIPQQLRDWLLDKGSLTQRLKTAYPDSFRVQVIRHEWGLPTASERHFLTMNEHEIASIREVVLYGGEQPRVFARSILPASSLTGSNRCLLHLKQRPLGEFLFSQPSLQRGPIEITMLPANTFNPHLPVNYTPEQEAWGRRSLFFLSEKPISVCEFFLPD